jgi:outer membrane protein OmpA-like peptidoglycan-associated protein
MVRAERSSAAPHATRRLALALALLSSCAGADLASGVGKVRDQLETARSKGAYRCAPRELASGEANAEFAEREFGKGEYFVAKDRLEAAQAAAKEALRLSSDERTCPKPKPQPPRRKEPAPDPLADRDGDGIPDIHDKCPNEPEDRDGFEDDDGCPDPDNDKDGIPDAVDKCPNEPEDFDGFQDEDGCPDPDNDQDGVLDSRDRCPNEPGPASNDGCPPKFEFINVTQEKIELKQAIFFQTAKAVIMPKSFGLLGEVAAVLNARTSMHVRIEGHTDSRGAHAYNVRLSQARADSVKAYLVGKGIGSDRMEAKGYGPDQPIDNNKTSAGRERNRRVEFMITQQ